MKLFYAEEDIAVGGVRPILRGAVGLHLVDDDAQLVHCGKYRVSVIAGKCEGIGDVLDAHERVFKSFGLLRGGGEQDAHMACELLFVARVDTAADGFLCSDGIGKLLGVGAGGGEDILPAASAYTKELADTVAAKKAIGGGIDTSYEEKLAGHMSVLLASATKKAEALEYALMGVKDITDTLALARYYRDTIFAAMNELRIIVDEMETHCAAKYWPYPSYGDILFSVK